MDDWLKSDDSEKPWCKADTPGQRQDHEHDKGLGPGCMAYHAVATRNGHSIFLLRTFLYRMY